jgi:hypothetical protein
MKQIKFRLKSEILPARSSNSNWGEGGGKLIQRQFLLPRFERGLNAQVKSDLDTGINFTFRPLKGSWSAWIAVFFFHIGYRKLYI